MTTRSQLFVNNHAWGGWMPILSGYWLLWNQFVMDWHHVNMRTISIWPDQMMEVQEDDHNLQDIRWVFTCTAGWKRALSSKAHIHRGRQGRDPVVVNSATSQPWRQIWHRHHEWQKICDAADCPFLLLLTSLPPVTTVVNGCHVPHHADWLPPLFHSVALRTYYIHVPTQAAPTKTFRRHNHTWEEITMISRCSTRTQHTRTQKATLRGENSHLPLTWTLIVLHNCNHRPGRTAVETDDAVLRGTLQHWMSLHAQQMSNTFHNAHTHRHSLSYNEELLVSSL